MSRESVWGHLCVAWFAILFTFAFALHGCTGDKLGPIRVASNEFADQISAQGRSAAYDAQIAGATAMQTCAPTDRACRVTAETVAYEAAAEKIAKINQAASLQKLLVNAIETAAACQKTPRGSCFDDAFADATKLAALLETLLSKQPADAGVDGDQ